MPMRHTVTTAPVASVAAGVAVINPSAGIVAAGGAPVVSDGLNRLVDRISDRRRTKQGYILEWAARIAEIDPDDLERSLHASPDIRELLLRVMESAGATDISEKLICFSIALADSVQDPTPEHVALENAFVRTLDDLDQSHLNLLERFTWTSNRLGLGDGSAAFDSVPEALNRGQIELVANDLPIVSSLIAVLERQGLVTFDGLYYRITDFGTAVLDRLDEVGQVLSEARSQSRR